MMAGNIQQMQLPCFVFMDAGDSWFSGQVLVWFFPTHVMIRFDVVRKDAPNAPSFVTQLIPIKELEGDNALFFDTRDDLNKHIVSMGSPCDDDFEVPPKTALN